MNVYDLYVYYKDFDAEVAAQIRKFIEGLRPALIGLSEGEFLESLDSLRHL